MDLVLSADRELWRDTTRRFLDETCDIAGVRLLETSADGFDRSWWRQAAELGWTSNLVPEALGGGSVSGEGIVDLAMVAREIGRGVAPGPLVPCNVVAAAISASNPPAGSPLAQLLDGLLGGNAIGAWCLDAAGRPWGGAGGIATTAQQSGDGVVLTGTTSPVEAGAQASHLLVTARDSAGALLQAVVPATAPGVTVNPRRGVDLIRRYAVVHLDEVRVPGDFILRSADPAADVERQLQIANVVSLAETVGAIERVFEFTLEWAFDRHSFGRPLASYQALKHRIADMRLYLEACRATTHAAVHAVQRGQADAGELVSAAKSYVSDHAPEIVQDCVQLHGGIGVTWDHDIHLYLRRVTVNAAMYGTAHDHRLRLADAIARAGESA